MKEVYEAIRNHFIRPEYWDEEAPPPPKSSSLGIDVMPKQQKSPEDAKAPPQQGIVVSAAHAKQIQTEMEDMKALTREINELNIYRPGKTVRERIQILLFPNLHGFRSCELMTAYYCGVFGVITGMMLRKTSAFRDSIRRFRVQHNLSLFENKKDFAVRQVNFIGWNWIMDDVPRSLRIGAICFMSAFTALGIAAIRDRFLLRDLVVGYATAGFFYRLQRGFKAAFAWSIIGTGFGCLAVILIYPYLLYNGTTLDGMYKEHRQKYFADKLKYLREQRYIRELMVDEDIWYWEAKQKYKQMKADEMERLATLHRLNVNSFINTDNNVTGSSS